MSSLESTMMSSNSALATVAAFSGTLSIIGLVLIVLTIIAMWKIFTKAGEAGWKSIVPILNMYILYKISWKKMNMFWICLGTGLVAGILSAVMSGITASGGTPSQVLVLIAALFMIVAAIISIIMDFKLAKAFGHGAGFGVGLWLINTIFILILGFGKSTYVGPQEN